MAVDLYTTPGTTPLNAIQVEQAVKEAIFTAYDNASNGNRTRGGMKRAYDMYVSPCKGATLTQFLTGIF
jgi:hypothetical protein